MSDNPPGWYRDPAEPTTQRYWDGDGWVGETLPVDATPPEGPILVSPPATPASGWIVPPPGGMPVPGAPGEPPSAIPTAQIPTAQIPTAQIPAAQIPTAEYPPSAYPPGAYPPGAYPPGAYPPGSYPPGAPPTGSMPPFPQYPYQPGAVPPPPGWPPGLPFPPYAVAKPRPHGFDLAPLGSRFVARIVDFLAVLILNAVLNGYLVYQYFHETGPYWRAAIHAQRTGGTLPEMSGQGSTLGWVILAFAVVIWGVYEVPSTGRVGQTLGKRLLGIRVIGLEGKMQLGGGRSFRRWLPLGLPMLLWTCGIGFLIQLIDCVAPTINRPYRLALHDVYAATVVVSVPRNTGAPTATEEAVPQTTANGGNP